MRNRIKKGQAVFPLALNRNDKFGADGSPFYINGDAHSASQCAKRLVDEMHMLTRCAFNNVLLSSPAELVISLKVEQAR